MRYRIGALLLTLACLTGAAQPSQSADSLLLRMAQVNPNLHTFSATLRAHVALKSFPFLATDLVGTYYYKEPDKNKVVFTSGVPVVAAQFDKLYAHIESPSQWQKVYTVTTVSDDGSTTVFRLVPRIVGNVDHIDALVDDASATVKSMRWNYANGGYAQMTNRYGNVGGYVVVQSQTAHVELPGYTADISSTIDNYKFNPALSDGIFQ
jgi:outer membrane lipoprotein-sorting protein